MVWLPLIVLGTFLNVLGVAAEKPAVAYGGAAIASLGVVWMLVFIYRTIKER